MTETVKHVTEQAGVRYPANEAVTNVPTAHSDAAEAHKLAEAIQKAAWAIVHPLEDHRGATVKGEQHPRSDALLGALREAKAVLTAVPEEA